MHKCFSIWYHEKWGLNAVFMVLFVTGMLSIVFCPASAQWAPLPNAPSTTTRIDDVYFIDDNKGWSCSGDGFIHHTPNGGQNWYQQFFAPEYLRSIEFISPTRGFCGSLDGNVYRTTNGGITWTNITSSLPVAPYGICGISHFGATVFLTGNWSNDAALYKSLDSGVTWSYMNLSNLANNLVDCLFTGPGEVL